MKRAISPNANASEIIKTNSALFNFVIMLTMISKRKKTFSYTKEFGYSYKMLSEIMPIKYLVNITKNNFTFINIL